MNLFGLLELFSGMVGSMHGESMRCARQRHRRYDERTGRSFSFLFFSFLFFSFLFFSFLLLSADAMVWNPVCRFYKRTWIWSMAFIMLYWVEQVLGLEERLAHSWESDLAVHRQTVSYITYLNGTLG
jgi:hypothetical protein